MEAAPKPGTRVRFSGLNQGPFGVMEHPPESGMRPYFVTDHVVQNGDEGVYDKPLPKTGPDWHSVTVERDGRTLYCPTTLHYIELV